MDGILRDQSGIPRFQQHTLSSWRRLNGDTPFPYELYKRTRRGENNVHNEVSNESLSMTATGEPNSMLSPPLSEGTGSLIHSDGQGQIEGTQDEDTDIDAIQNPELHGTASSVTNSSEASDSSSLHSSPFGGLSSSQTPERLANEEPVITESTNATSGPVTTEGNSRSAPGPSHQNRNNPRRSTRYGYDKERDVLLSSSNMQTGPGISPVQSPSISIIMDQPSIRHNRAARRI